MGGAGSQLPEAAPASGCVWVTPSSVVGPQSRVPAVSEARYWGAAWETVMLKPGKYKMLLQIMEKHFGELCQIFSAHVWKTAKMQEKADLLVNEINMYACTDTSNLKQGLKNFAVEFANFRMKPK